MSALPEQDDESDDLREGIYQNVESGLVDALSREFRPWHRPRKYFIRVHQWCAQIRELMKAIGMRAGDTMRYLGMPGEDFLDLRSMHGVCAPEEVRLRYLGFDATSVATQSEYEFNLSQHEVANLRFIDPLSVVCRDRIEQIADEASLATKQVARHGPFDVVNIDLCDSVANASIGRHSYFLAFRNLCNSQNKQRSKPWLMFLTTRAGREHVDDETKRRLLQCIIENIDGSVEFEALLRGALQLDGAALRGEVSNSLLLAHAALVRAFGLGLGKWLLIVMMSANPKVHVRLLKSYSYRVHMDEPDMLSLAFWIAPVIEERVDRTGLTPPAIAAGGVPVTELELATELVKAIVDIEDIDARLGRDKALNEKMIQKSADLMASARYARDAYLEWVRAQDRSLAGELVASMGNVGTR